MARPKKPDVEPDWDSLSDDDIREMFPPIYIGNSWRRNDDGSWLLPERTLGWEIAGWCAQWLRGPDGGPWRFTLEQLRLILWWYALDCNGEFVYRTGVIQRLKGHGKDPLLAVICLVEMCGPSRFAGWAKDGTPVGKAHPDAWVQVAAVSRDQTQNTMAVFPSLMTEEFKQRFGITPGVELIRGMGGRVRIEAVTSSPRSLEGRRSTFVVLNETHHWVEGNQGWKMHETIDGNTTKVNSRYLAITNAYMPGEESVAERMRRDYVMVAEGRAKDTGLMYDSVEANPSTPLKERVLEVILPMIRGDSVWLPIQLIIKSIMSTSIDVARSRRMWLNQVVAASDAFYDEAMLDAITDRDNILLPGEAITLGFDGGKTDDATALVAFRIVDQKWFLLALWERPDGPQGDGWTVPRQEVDDAIHAAFEEYEVKAFFADVALWESYIVQWENAYADRLAIKATDRSPIGWDMRRSLQAVTRAHERMAQAIFDEDVRIAYDIRMRRHILNVRQSINNYGVSFRKESRESPKKVDIYAAMLLAYEAAYTLRTKAKTERQRTGRGYFF